LLRTCPLFGSPAASKASRTPTFRAAAVLQMRNPIPIQKFLRTELPDELLDGCDQLFDRLVSAALGLLLDCACCSVSHPWASSPASYAVIPDLARRATSRLVIEAIEAMFGKERDTTERSGGKAQYASNGKCI
jgi:hypothetical protein